MPTFVVPHRSGAHRVAAIALYRALLSQCRRAPLPVVHGQELYNLIRNRVRAFRHTTSHRELNVAFEAGYEAVDYLDAAVAGRQAAKDYILNLLQRAPRNAKVDPRESPRQFLRRHYGHHRFGAPGAQPSDLARGTTTSGPGDVSRPDAPSPELENHTPRAGDEDEDDPFPADARRSEFRGGGGGGGSAAAAAPPAKRDIFAAAVPKEQLGGTGKRKVPVLFNANGIPVLRVTKPMPAKLSSFLNSRIQQRDRRQKFKHDMEAAVQLGREEDRWDAILHQRAGIDSTRGEAAHGAITYGRGSWAEQSSRALRGVVAALQEERQKNRVMAEKMQAVVDREAELARLEMDQEERQLFGDVMDDITEQDTRPRPHEEEVDRAAENGPVSYCFK